MFKVQRMVEGCPVSLTYPSAHNVGHFNWNSSSLTFAQYNYYGAVEVQAFIKQMVVRPLQTRSAYSGGVRNL